MTLHQQIAMQRGTSEWRIDDDEIVASPQGFGQSLGRAGFIHDVVEEILLAGQHMQPLGDELRRTLEEQVIDALRCFQCRSQARAGLHVEQDSAASAVEVAIQQHGVAIGALAQMPGEICRDRTGADTATNAGDGHDPSALQRLRPTERFMMTGPKCRATISRVIGLNRYSLTPRCVWRGGRS